MECQEANMKIKMIIIEIANAYCLSDSFIYNNDCKGCLKRLKFDGIQHFDVFLQGNKIEKGRVLRKINEAKLN